jgi:segregation and condensation protein B
MTIKMMEAALEAVLFASGEPVPVERLAEVLEADRPAVLKILSRMADRINSEEGGVMLLQVGDCYQFATRPEYAGYIRRALDLKRNMPLSQAALEVLAIVAYNQPVTRGYVEQVRGVDSSGVICLLTEKGLIEERGRLDAPGRPLLYGTTPNFLRCFGLRSLSELPRVDEIQAAASD